MIQTLLSVARPDGRIYAKCPGDVPTALSRVRGDDRVWDNNVRIHWTLDAASLERIRFWFEPESRKA